MKIGLICGGPSLERGISLNSARSVLDHLQQTGIEVVPFYLDQKKRAYKISSAQLYSNTPSDFDFKLKQAGKALSPTQFIHHLKKTDVVFPVMHGAFGEDGGLQTLLERNHIPFIGSDASACRRLFDKFIANTFIKKQGFFTLPSTILKIYQHDHQKIIHQFFQTHHLKRAIVKPASGGSSIGVFSVRNPKEALEKTKLIFSKRMDTRIVLEPFATGIEFTVIILENRFGLPVAILPTEIETDYTKNQIFDFRKKYLPTRHVTYHCPPRFSNEVIEQIQIQAEQIFRAFGMRDFGRFDGWVLPDGHIWFSDFNPLSGMEQNSFLFQQASRIGLSHQEVLRHVLERACARYRIALPPSPPINQKHRKPIHVLFGGDTSERQVSLMSGTNVWLKLRSSNLYDAKPFLLDMCGSVWSLPYPLTLNHTVEEIAQNCEQAIQNETRLKAFEVKARLRLGLTIPSSFVSHVNRPVKMSLKTFMHSSPFVFIALHGGKGENGELQKQLEQHKIPFNGSREIVSRLCMDKFKTSGWIKQQNFDGIETIPEKIILLQDLIRFKNQDWSKYWRNLRRQLNAFSLIVKPLSDGCSSGIVRLSSAQELKTYVTLLHQGVNSVPNMTFKRQPSLVEMPLDKQNELLLQKWMETDLVRIKGNQLKYTRRTGLIEVTIGFLERKGYVHVFQPSLTVAEGDVLTVEEKFQGGTGINITPPPFSIVSSGMLIKAKKHVEELVRKMGLQNYGRIDAFLQVATGRLIIIEVNTLPALTPSTVLFHQALEETPQLFPRDLLETIIRNTGY